MRSLAACDVSSALTKSWSAFNGVISTSVLLSAEELQQLVEAFHAGSERFALTALTYAQSERALQRLFTIDEAHTRYTIHELVTVETAWARNGEERAPTSASRFTRDAEVMASCPREAEVPVPTANCAPKNAFGGLKSQGFVIC